jgi:hypothetical protein
MPRKKSAVAVAGNLTINQQIHRQGVITLLEAAAQAPVVSGGNASDALASHFLAWLREEQHLDYNRLTAEFANSTVEGLA